MITKILILGESGTGKSTSIRNLPPKKTTIIGAVKKPLPFKSDELTARIRYSDDYNTIEEWVGTSKAPILVLDDVQYLMANQFMRSSSNEGYERFNKLAQNFWNLIQKIDTLEGDKTVYFLSHLERDAMGNEKFKTIGKLLDEKIVVEGLFTVVLKTVVFDGHYHFATQNSGSDTVKSPIGLFDEPLIDNDLAFVDSKIRAFYNLPPVQ